MKKVSHLIDSTESELTPVIIYERCAELFKHTGVQYAEWQHEPILDYATDARLATEFGWTAQPTKSLFLRCKNGMYALLFTHRDHRLDSKKMKQLLGQRSSVCSDSEMSQMTGCVAGAVCPFALPSLVPIVVDKSLLSMDDLMFTPGLPERTFAFAARELPLLLAALPNQVHWLD
ncbi:DNA-binding protein [Plesiomonas shigelloides]|nr:DNA-binding protein [Plesiomonas shigelloides]